MQLIGSTGDRIRPHRWCVPVFPVYAALAGNLLANHMASNCPALSPVPKEAVARGALRFWRAAPLTSFETDAQLFGQLGVF